MFYGSSQGMKFVCLCNDISMYDVNVYGPEREREKAVYGKQHTISKLAG